MYGKALNRPAATRPRRQRGVALITALLVVAIATIAAVQLADRQRLDIRRAQNSVARDQAYAYALGAEAGALAMLKHDLMNSDIDHLGEDEIWHRPQLLEYEGAQITLEIEDLQGRFDLNRLASLPADPQQAQGDLHYQRFRILLANVIAADPELARENFDPDALIAALADWMDTDLVPRPPAGAEDDYYLSLERPYRTANQPLASPSELMLIRGFTPRLVMALAPLVTALPGESRINVNTARPEVLRSLNSRISQELAEQLAEQARERPWQTVQAFVSDPAVANLAISPQGLTTSSGYFLAKSRVSLDRAGVPLYSLIRRAPDRSVRVISRGRGEP